MIEKKHICQVGHLSTGLRLQVTDLLIFISDISEKQRKEQISFKWMISVLFLFAVLHVWRTNVLHLLRVINEIARQGSGRRWLSTWRG